MRIWLGAATLGLGGAERVVVALARGLTERGHAVAVSGAPGPLDAELSGLAIHRVARADPGRSAPGVALAAGRLAGDLRRWRPDVVAAHSVRVAGTAAVAARLRGGPRRPAVVATLHGVSPADESRAARVLRLADAVVCVSTDQAEVLHRHGFTPARTCVIPNAVAAPAPLSRERHARLAAELRQDGGPLVVSVGRLVAQKNHERLLEAVARMRDRPDGLRVWIVGEGPLRAHLEARAGELGLAGRVRFAGRRLDAAEILAHADLAVFSSDFEGMSVAALEALAAGTPVITTPVSGMRELLGEGGGAIVPSTPAALAGALDELLVDGERRAAMGRAARRRFGGGGLTALLDAYERRLAAAARAR